MGYGMDEVEGGMNGWMLWVAISTLHYTTLHYKPPLRLHFSFTEALNTR